MKTIQMTIDEPLLKEVNRAIADLRTTRSAFIRQALEDALRRLDIQRQERKHQRGYARRPIKLGEFDVWEKEQEWGTE